MISFTSFSSIASIALLVIGLHPLHVSVTEIEHDEKDKRLEVMMRVFIDDLELTLRNNLNKQDLDLLDLKDGLTVDQLMNDYLKNRLKITVDSKPQQITLLGHEREGEAFIFYIEVSNIKKLKTIQVYNSIITETHDDQSNLVHVTVKGTVKSLRLTKDTPADKLTFDSK